jgi:predicted O-methyltransferase YrrM
VPRRLAGPGLRVVAVPVRFARAWLAGRALRREAAVLRGIGAAIDLTTTFRSHGHEVPALQRRLEIEPMLQLLAVERPKALLEIGTAGGGSLFLWSRVAADDALVMSIDLPWGRWGSGYPLTRVPLYRAFARAKQRIVLVRGDSHAQTSFDRVARALDGRPLEFLFIDGDHTYEGVRLDYEMYSKLVRPGGVIAFHDILTPSEDVGVQRFWAELRAAHPEAQEFLAPPPGQKGIGVIRMDVSGGPAGTL